MIARHEVSLFLCLDKLPVMDISRQFQSMTRDEASSVALPQLFEQNQINDQTTRYDKRCRGSRRSMRQDRDQADCGTIVADHKRIPQRHMIPSQVDSLAVYQINFLLSPHRCWQQTKQTADRFLSQPPLQITPFCSLRRCWQIMLGRPKHFLVWTSALSDTVVLTPTITKGLSTPVQPQHPSHEIMKSNQQVHDQRAAD
jgi:uncharacterized protein YqcC (DUF446 family)